MSELHKRTLEFQTRAVDEEKRTVELAFSSENPVERSFGFEVLDHSDGAVDLQRLNGGAALLVNHNTDDQVGVVETQGLMTTELAEPRFASVIPSELKKFSVMFRMAFADWFRWATTSSTRFAAK